MICIPAKFVFIFLIFFSIEPLHMNWNLWVHNCQIWLSVSVSIVFIPKIVFKKEDWSSHEWIFLLKQLKNIVNPKEVKVSVDKQYEHKGYQLELSISWLGKDSCSIECRDWSNYFLTLKSVYIDPLIWPYSLLQFQKTNKYYHCAENSIENITWWHCDIDH